MNIFKEAKEKKLDGFGYYSRRTKTIWENKTAKWNWLDVEYGIRRSYKWQLFPIWNLSNNRKRIIMFGFWKLYIKIIYYRKNNFNQDRKLFLRMRLWKFYQLFI